MSYFWDNLSIDWDKIDGQLTTPKVASHSRQNLIKSERLERYEVNALMVQVAVDSGFGTTHMGETAVPSAQRKKLGCRLVSLEIQFRRCNAQPDSAILTPILHRWILGPWTAAEVHRGALLVIIVCVGSTRRGQRPVLIFSRLPHWAQTNFCRSNGERWIIKTRIGSIEQCPISWIGFQLVGSICHIWHHYHYHHWRTRWPIPAQLTVFH